MNISRTAAFRTSLRNDTEDTFKNENPVLLYGELVIVQCENCIKLKIGDGEHHFDELDYIVDPEFIDFIVDNQRKLETSSNDFELRIEAFKKQFDRLTGWYLFTTAATLLGILFLHI